jgi:hypothetical protein
MTYSTAYTNIKSGAIDSTKKLAKNGFWKKNHQDRKTEICKQWLKEVSAIYGIETPTFRFDSSERMYKQTGGGYYEPSHNRITLFKKFSMVTFLHEFRHHMQHQMKLKLYKGDIEEDARAWSVSLFKCSTPKAYENSVRKGILHFK